MFQIIIPSVIDSGGGDPPMSVLYTILIFFNLMCVSIYLIRYLMYKINKPKESFFKYVIFDNSLDENFVTYINTLSFLIINGLAISIALIALIESFL